MFKLAQYLMYLIFVAIIAFWFPTYSQLVDSFVIEYICIYGEVTRSQISDYSAGQKIMITRV